MQMERDERMWKIIISFHFTKTSRKPIEQECLPNAIHFFSIMPWASWNVGRRFPPSPNVSLPHPKQIHAMVVYTIVFKFPCEQVIAATTSTVLVISNVSHPPQLTMTKILCYCFYPTPSGLPGFFGRLYPTKSPWALVFFQNHTLRYRTINAERACLILFVRAFRNGQNRT